MSSALHSLRIANSGEDDVTPCVTNHVCFPDASATFVRENTKTKRIMDSIPALLPASGCLERCNPRLAESAVLALLSKICPSPASPQEKNMKITSTLSFLGFLALGGVAIAADEKSSGDAEKTVAALEEQWTQAERSNNADQIAPLLADKIMITDAEGKIMNRTDFLAYEKANRYSSSELSNVKVTVFGDTAIARYAVHQKYTLKGKAFDTSFQETDTWVKMPGANWQCVAGHASTMAKK